MIREIRIKNGLTQKQFADKYNVTSQAVSKWERGFSIPDITILSAICKDFSIDLNELVQSDYKKRKKFSQKNNGFLWISIIGAIVLMIIGLWIIYQENNFEFKTISSSCTDFEISGSISYNKRKSAIYISNIDYCGLDKDEVYSELVCILYEVDKNSQIKIASYEYKKDEKITLETFLKNVRFTINNYSSVCEKFQDDNLFLVIKARDKNDKTISYDIPLTLNSNCNKE